MGALGLVPDDDNVSDVSDSPAEVVALAALMWCLKGSNGDDARELLDLLGRSLARLPAFSG